MNIKIITADPTLLQWTTLPKKKAAILAALNQAKHANFTIDFEYRDIVPEVKNSRITHGWFDGLTKPLYYKGHYFVGFHAGDKQRKTWGIQPTLRGVNHLDEDNVGELYFWADEHTRRNGFSQFIETMLHEIRHELMRGMGLPDDTHALHDKHGTLVEQFAQLDVNDYRPRYRLQLSLISILQTLRGLLTTATELPKKKLSSRS